MLIKRPPDIEQSPLKYSNCVKPELPLKHWLSLATSTSAARLHTLSLPDLHRRLIVDGRIAHALLDLARHGQESLLDVDSVLGRCL